MKNVNIVKIWSWSINDQNIKNLLSDISKIQQKTNDKFLIVTSWAVKEWKEECRKKWISVWNLEKSNLATIGHSKIVDSYRRYYDWVIWDILLHDKYNIDYLKQLWLNIDENMFETFKKLDFLDNEFLVKCTLQNNICNWILTVVNHNDAMTNKELAHLSDKTDNDKNVPHLCELIYHFQKEINFKVKNVIYLTWTNWLLDQDWNTIKWWQITDEESKNFYKNFVIVWEKSHHWTWWMLSKVDWSINVLDYWIQNSFIANAKDWLDCLEWKWKYTTFYK